MATRTPQEHRRSPVPKIGVVRHLGNARLSSITTPTGADREHACGRVDCLGVEGWT